MYIKNNSLNDPIIYKLKFGEFYFYENFIVTEIYEGCTIGKECFLEILSLVNEHWGSEKPYGIISNRLNSYTVNLAELIPVGHKFGRFIANAVVVYSEITLKSFELEKRVLGFKGEVFFNTNQAVEWINTEIMKAEKEPNLN